MTVTLPDVLHGVAVAFCRRSWLRGHGDRHHQLLAQKEHQHVHRNAHTVVDRWLRVTNGTCGHSHNVLVYDRQVAPVPVPVPVPVPMLRFHSRGRAGRGRFVEVPCCVPVPVPCRA